MAEVMVEEMINNATDTVVDGGKFLSFFLGAEEYAIEILKVQAVSYTHLTLPTICSV